MLTVLHFHISTLYLLMHLMYGRKKGERGEGSGQGDVP